MTGEINLGLEPGKLEVRLTAGSDFLCTLYGYNEATGTDEDWPVGTVITLLIGALTWTASIAGNLATFSVDKATADTVTARTPAKLIYTNGSTDTVWAVGMVVRRDG